MLRFTLCNQELSSAFELPLSSDNRWVRYAFRLPWEKLNCSFPDVLSDFKAVFSDPLRTALACRLIQMQYNVSDEELLLMIQENPYFQFFCGFSDFDSKRDRIGKELLEHFSQIPEDTLSDIIGLCSCALKENPDTIC